MSSLHAFFTLLFDVHVPKSSGMLGVKKRERKKCPCQMGSHSIYTTPFYTETLCVNSMLQTFLPPFTVIYKLDHSFYFQAILEFYHSTDRQSQQEINRWLTHGQISPQAWLFSWRLLSKDKACSSLLLEMKSRTWQNELQCCSPLIVHKI